MTIFQSLREFYLGRFNEMGEPYFKILCTGAVAKMVFLAKYGELEPMSEKESRELYRYVIGLMPELTKPERIDAAKIIYAIGHSYE